jgi:hypothetical protein
LKKPRRQSPLAQPRKRCMPLAKADNDPVW